MQCEEVLYRTPAISWESLIKFIRKLSTPERQFKVKSTAMSNDIALQRVTVTSSVSSSGTKKKVRWLFGFSNGNQDYEVILVVSLLSGKKVLPHRQCSGSDCV